MANKKSSSKTTKGTSRSMRIQQIIFLAICVIIVLAMVLSMVMKF